MDRVKTLIVDDEAETWLRILQRRVSAHGVDLEPETNPRNVLNRVKVDRPHVVLLDVMFPDTDGKSKPIGVELLAQLNAHAPGLPVVMFTVTLADDSSSVGTSDFPGAAFVFSKSVFSEVLPDEQDPYADLARCLKNAVSEAALRSQLDERVGWVVGQSRAMQDLALGVLRVAPTDLPVLICGESGTGKELVAQTLHRMSLRSEGAFLKVNCGALSDETLESALFGHEKGAFTGAATAKAGLFEEADGGTLFLDEVQSMSPRMQQTLLRALQEGVIRRMGSTRERRIDVRILAATNEDLASKVAQGNFRADLYYRLNRVPVVVPPLRERKGDLAALFARFVLSANRKIGRSVSSQCRADVLRLLEAHDWPGNVRELESAIEAAVALAGSNLLTPADFPNLPASTHMEARAPASGTTASVDESERGSSAIELGGANGDLTWARLKDIKGEHRRKLLLDYISRQASLTGHRPTSSSLASSLGTSADNLRRVLSEAGIRLREIEGS